MPIAKSDDQRSVGVITTDVGRHKDMARQLKKIAFLVPRSGLSQEAFTRYWRETHGPLVAGSPGYGEYRRKYVQNHLVGRP